MLSSSWKGVSWKAKNVHFQRMEKNYNRVRWRTYFISESRRNCLTEMVFGGLYVFHTKRYFLTRLKLRRGNQLDNTQSEESMTSWFQRSQTRKYLNNCPAWSFDKLSVTVSFCQLVNVCFSDWPHWLSPVCCSWNSVCLARRSDQQQFPPCVRFDCDHVFWLRDRVFHRIDCVCLVEKGAWRKTKGMFKRQRGRIYSLKHNQKNHDKGSMSRGGGGKNQWEEMQFQGTWQTPGSTCPKTKIQRISKYIVSVFNCKLDENCKPSEQK